MLYVKNINVLINVHASEGAEPNLSTEVNWFARNSGGKEESQ